MNGKIARLDMVVDATGGGEPTNCPHCGALGRYIYYFTLENGEKAGAMKGCYKAWPKSSRFAYDYAKIREKKIQVIAK
jgi:hypothetical protein